MSGFYFFDGLDNILNEDTSMKNNPSLLQGQKFKTYEKNYVAEVTPYLHALQISSIPGLKKSMTCIGSCRVAPTSLRIFSNLFGADFN